MQQLADVGLGDRHGFGRFDDIGVAGSQSERKVFLPVSSLSKNGNTSLR
jgi:hypothetical protein